MEDALDIGSSCALVAVLGLAMASYAFASAMAGRALSAKRVEREQGLPLLGKVPMHAVFRALGPIGDALVALGVGANAITVSSLVFAVLAAISFATGHFGVGALVACVAALADALDGLVARTRGTVSRFGQVLDTTVDRYVDVLLLGGIAVCFRGDVVVLVVALGAIAGGFMVSYASSIERELGVTEAASAIPMRRAHRLAYVLTGAALAPLVGFGPLVVALSAIAVIGNESAVKRLFSAARRAAPKPVTPERDSQPVVGSRSHAPVPEGARR